MISKDTVTWLSVLDILCVPEAFELNRKHDLTMFEYTASFVFCVMHVNHLSCCENSILLVLLVCVYSQVIIPFWGILASINKLCREYCWGKKKQERLDTTVQ